ncbi:MAG: AmmeMemoRadiSam system radical SAM enzyme [Candidatus Micrarchaeia archaeon]
MKEALFYKKLKNKEVKCNLCARGCIIKEGSTGVCGVRKNIDGKLYSLVYGKVIALALDPIEKKPLFHFYPGARVLSFGTVGCNFMCEYCQNWDISQTREIMGEEISPEEMVEKAIEVKAKGITYTYNEPTIFMEYAMDTAKIAKKEKLFNTFVSNGYMSEEAAKEASKFLDAITIDFKGSGDRNFLIRYAHVPSEEPVFNTLKIMHEAKVHVEITDLIVPKVGDDLEKARKLIKWVVENLGDEVPMHFLRFFPMYRMLDFPITPTETLEKIVKIAKEEGIKYAYIGNIPGHKFENTYCPYCGELLIERYGFEIIKNKIQNGKCPKCKKRISGVFNGND